MKCPHCTLHFHDDWHFGPISRTGTSALFAHKGFWYYRNAICGACKGVTIELVKMDERGHTLDSQRVFPFSANRRPVPAEVPPHVARDYVEACDVLSISAKASAALSRRCLQTMLHVHGYVAKDLAKEIDLLLNEPDPKKALPHKIRQAIDGIRSFGNFSAHPIDDKTTLQIIDVEPHEAEWCLETIEEMFEHFYVGPAAAAAMKAALDLKLQAAGKPPSK